MKIEIFCMCYVARIQRGPNFPLLWENTDRCTVESRLYVVTAAVMKTLTGAMLWGQHSTFKQILLGCVLVSLPSMSG